MHKQWTYMENTSLRLVNLAANTSDEELVRELDTVQPDLWPPLAGHVNREGRTLLHVTAVRERLEALALLLKARVDVEAKDGQGFSPLYACIINNSMTAAHVLVQHGADVSESVCRSTGETMLHKMVKAGRYKTVEFLLESGALVNTGTRDGNTALHYTARYERNHMATMLLDAHSDINAVNESGETVLHVSIANANFELAKQLIKRKASVSIKDRRGRTPLHAAVAAGAIELVRMMLTINSSHINSKEPLLGRTPLLLASSNGTQQMASLLLQHGADANLTTNYRKSVLHIAASTGNTEVLGTVIRFTSNLNARAINNMTCLHYAVVGGHKEIVRLLLRSGVSPNMKDINGDSPMHVASADGKTDIVLALLQYDSQVNSTNMQQQTALHLALLNGHKEIGAILVRAGSDVNLLDVHDKKASDYSAELEEIPTEQDQEHSGGDITLVSDIQERSCSQNDKLHVHFSGVSNEELTQDSSQINHESNSIKRDTEGITVQTIPGSQPIQKTNITSQHDDRNKMKRLESNDENSDKELQSKTDNVAINEISQKDEYTKHDLKIELDNPELGESKKRKGKHKKSSRSKEHRLSSHRKQASGRRKSNSLTLPEAGVKGEHTHEVKGEHTHEIKGEHAHESQRKRRVGISISK